MSRQPPSLAGVACLPRFLSREEAAWYVGVSENVFDREVANGTWPAPWRRGGKGGRVTWDRQQLDRYADRDAARLDSQPELPPTMPPAAGQGPAGEAPPPVNSPAHEEWRKRLHGTPPQQSPRPRRPQAAR